jgi:hypothetical protein
MIRLPHLLLGLALVAPFATAQPTRADFPTPPNFPPKAHDKDLWREPLAPTASGETRIKFSDPAKPGTLKLNLPWADVKIVGTDAADVTIRSSLEKKRTKTETDDEGFRRLDDEASFEVHEKDNIVVVSTAGDDHTWFNPGAEFTVEVPRRTNLILRTQLGGDISVSRIDGEIDVNGMNGDVSLDQISGATVVNTMNGEVRAVFAATPAKPVSITSMNGEIDVHLPADAKANLRLRTHNGSIRTNFPDGVLTTKTERVTGRVPGSGYAYAIGSAAADVERLAREAAQMAREQGELARAVAAEQAAAAQDAAAGAREAARAARNEARAAGRANAATPVAAPAPVAVAAPADPADAPTAPSAPRFAAAAAAFGGKSIVGALNGGGVDISLSSMNGTITLRQRK